MYLFKNTFYVDPKFSFLSCIFNSHHQDVEEVALLDVYPNNIIPLSPSFILTVTSPCAFYFPLIAQETFCNSTLECKR